MDLFSQIKDKVPSAVALTESGIKAGSVVKEEHEIARERVIEKLDENIKGLTALKDGKEYPTREANKKGNTPSFARWFKYKASSQTYEATIKYGNNIIDGILGKEGKKDRVGVECSNYDEIIAMYEVVKSSIKNGELDKWLLEAREKAKKRLQNSSSNS